MITLAMREQINQLATWTLEKIPDLLDGAEDYTIEKYREAYFSNVGTIQLMAETIVELTS